MKIIKNILSIFLILSVITIISGCSDIAIMNPKGQIGIEQRSLILISLGMMLIVVIPAIIMTIIFVIKYKSSNKKTIYKPNWSKSKKIEFVIWTIPIFIIIFLANLTWKSTHSLDPKKSIESNIKPIVIQAIALDWKWLFIYPEYNVASINEISFPINSPIRFEVTSNSVMNSFFIPKLGTQIYAMAGMNNTLNLIANEPNNYKGISSNFSGKGFSGMKFTAIATPDLKTFHQWIDKIKISKKIINSINDYEQLTNPSEYCPVEYFSKVYPNLYKDVIYKFTN